MVDLTLILGAVILVSLVSLLGALTLLKTRLVNTLLFVFASFAAGTLLGSAFLGLLPEAIEEATSVEFALFYALAGVVLFFIIERGLHWHHYHAKKESHPFTYLNLIGDGIHNFVDGVLITASFFLSVPLGFATTLAIIVHEIPQELSDFGLLIYGGWSAKRALVANFITALTAVVGAIVGYLFLSVIETAIVPLVSIAAGGFLYIASADLVPEIHKERDWKKIIVQILVFLLGIAIIWAVGVFGPSHSH
ncbi:MAG: ZIP family metal transporter [Nanoarchaeota archaeon]|nr:ZIP family metal transporter [Nanoarchaeota archaeon]